MDYGEQDNGASGRFPEFGAIFLSNTQTMKKSLKQNIFALPSSHAEFVKHIKAGMVLFLFEFGKRELFGVYQASSDGRVDIAPHAFSYSGQHFPAQVHVRRIWHCDPLSEREFKGAIIENYFSAKRFNLGLSKEQVGRLLYLFSSRKKMPPQPRSEAITEVAVKKRRLVGGDMKELSETEYITPTEYDEHVSSLARGREDERLVDNRISAEGKIYPFSQGDVLSKRRRIGKEGKFITNRVAENGAYSHLYERTFCADSPVDCLDEIRTLANTGKVLPVQMANEVQLDKIQNLVQSSEYFLDPLDMHDDYTSMQWRTLPDDCLQIFASDHYGNPVGQSKHVIDGDRFLANDCARRDCTIDPVTSVALSDDVCRQAREIEKDKEWLKNREHKLRYHFDCDDSTFSAIDPSVRLLHRIRKTDAAERFQIDENEPNLGTCSVAASAKNVLHPWQCGYRTIEGRKCPIVDGRSTENLVDKVPSIMVTSGGYFPTVDRRMVDDARLIKSERIHDQEASHPHTNPIMAMRYPSIPQLERNSSSFSDKILEKQLSQLTPSPNFDRLRATFDDATITRTVPYLPDYPILSHGYLVSNDANQTCTSMQKNYPRDGSLGNFYPQSSKGLQQYYLKSEKSSSRPLDTAIEFEDNGFATSPSGHRSSLLRGSSHSLANPIFSTDMDLNISAHVNYRGSLSSKLSPPCTDLENEGKKELHYYSKPSGHHFAFDGKLHEASKNQSKHVPQHDMAMPSSQDFCYSESKDLGMDICELEGRLPSNMNPKELHENSGANSTSRRKSVFSRLYYKEKEPSQFGEERKGIEVNHQDCYMDATADEVMALLKPDDNLSVRKLKKSQVVGQPRESTVSEKKPQFHMETDPSTVEKRSLNSASQEATTHSIDEIRKETRILDFKRRSLRKNLVGTGAGSASHSNCTGAKEEAKSSTSSTLRRKKLIRPAFGRADAASDATAQGNETSQTPARIHDNEDKNSFETDSPSGAAARDNETLQNPALMLDKDDKKSIETDTASDAAIQGNDTLQTHAPIQDQDDKQSSETDTAGDAGTKGSDTLQISAQILDEVDKQSRETDIATRGNETLQTPDLVHDKDDKQIGTATSLCEPVVPKDSTTFTPDLVHDKDDKQIGTATSLCEPVVPKDSTTFKNVSASHNHPQEQQDAVVHVLPSQSIDLDRLEHGHGDRSSEVLNETSEQKTFVIQTSAVAGVSPKDTDATVTGSNLPEPSLKRAELDTGLNLLEPSLERVELDTGLNLPEPSLEQVELDTGCRNNLTEEKHLNKMQIVVTTKKDVKASSQ